MTSATTSLPPLFDAHGGRDHAWARIANDLAEALREGVYGPGQRLPSEYSLAQRFAVNRHTVRRSLAALGQRGLVRIAQGSGTYVEDGAVELSLSRRTRHRHNLAQAGLLGGLRVLQACELGADAIQALALAVPAGSPLLCLQVLGEGGGQPLHWSERCFPLPRFAGLDDWVRRTGSITEGFAALGVGDYLRRESRISAQLPSAEVAAHLRQAPGRPVLRVSSVNVDTQGRPIEWAHAWFAGDRVSLMVSHDD